MQGGDEVVMLFAGFVITEKFSLQNVFEEFRRDGARTFFIGLRAADGKLQRVVGSASVAIRERGDAEEDVVRSFCRFVAQAMLSVLEGAAEKLDDLRRSERIENVDLGAGEKRRNHFERRILRCRADEDDVAGLHVREKSILLSFVEAMNFVDEDDGAMAGAGFMLGHGHDFLDFLDAGEDGAEGNEFGTCQSGDKAREGGFPAAGRAPEEHRTKIVVFDLNAEGFSRAEKFFLPNKFIERARTHAFGKRLVGGGYVRLGGGWRQF